MKTSNNKVLFTRYLLVRRYLGFFVYLKPCQPDTRDFSKYLPKAPLTFSYLYFDGQIIGNIFVILEWNWLVKTYLSGAQKYPTQISLAQD